MHQRDLLGRFQHNQKKQNKVWDKNSFILLI